MLFKTFSAAVFGIDAYLVEVEVDVVPAFEGDFNCRRPARHRREGKPRTHHAPLCAIAASIFPSAARVTINLAPADIRKEGSAFDLPMALGLAGCQGSFFGKILDTHVFLGELSLDGGVRSVRGALSAALAARERGIKNVVVPEANAREAAVVEGIRRLRREIAAASRGPDQRARIFPARCRGHFANACGSQPIFRGPARRARADCPPSARSKSPAPAATIFC